MRLRFIAVLMLIWVATLAASLAWNWRQAEQTILAMVRIEAQSHFEKDLVYRRWAAIQGGIYVSPTTKTPPNPHLAFLHDRDVVTTGGKRLTLVNPAYMTRQVHELAALQYGVRSHITSLRPLRPENRPDAWEKQALRAFETGAKEVVSLETMADGPYLRFMRPMPTEAVCLKCHEGQGYRVGDIRGGISVSVPFAPYARLVAVQHRTLLFGHLGIGLFGLGALWLGGWRLRQSENLLRQSLAEAKHLADKEDLLLSSLGEGVYGTDAEGRCNFINPAALAMLGLDAAAVIGQDQHRLFHSRKADGSPYPHEECPIYLTLRDGQKRESEDAFLRGDEPFPVSLSVTAMKHGDDIVGAVVVFQDIGERKRVEQRIRQLAYYDTLTNLPNRRLLLDRLEHALTQAKRFQRSLAVMFLDLDHFKQVNDSLGHDAGDDLLRQVGRRLEACLRAGDTVARTGGDEFVILLAEISQPDDAALVADKVIASFKAPVPVQGRLLEITTSIGIAVYPVDGSDNTQELMKKADQAMYQAKEAGRGCYRFYREGDLV
jgi:diguanylate cyclase (GGDEF)-like protein/PAS domain S-box-containing protein